jgi:hypothetical protein
MFELGHGFSPVALRLERAHFEAFGGQVFSGAGYPLCEADALIQFIPLRAKLQAPSLAQGEAAGSRGREGDVS